MQKPLVGVVISSRADFSVMRRGLETLRIMGVPYLFEVLSPYRTPERLASFATSAADKGIEVFIAAGGGGGFSAHHLSAYTNLPIIGVPIDASPLRGQDTLYAMVMSPPGSPVATVGINNAENAALLAAQILAIKHVEVRRVLAHRRMAGVQRIEVLQKELTDEYPDLCLPERTMPALSSLGGDVDTEGGVRTPTPTDQDAPPTPGTAPDRADWIRPGATLVERPSAGALAGLVKTPVPQEPAAPQKPSSGQVNVAAVQTSLVPPEPRPTIVSPTQPAVALTPERRETPPRASVVTGVLNRPAKGAEAPAAPLEPAPTPLPPLAIHTKVFSIDRLFPDEDIVDHAMMVVLEGGILGLQTDTVFGLVADATNAKAVERLANLQGADASRSLGVLIPNTAMLHDLARAVPTELERVLEMFWPGGLTIVIPAKTEGVVPGLAERDMIGVRVPRDRVCLQLLGRVARPLAVRSARRADGTPIVNVAQLRETFTDRIECLLDGGEVAADELKASTVLSAEKLPFEIHREGSVPRQALKQVLGAHLKD